LNYDGWHSGIRRIQRRRPHNATTQLEDARAIVEAVGLSTGPALISERLWTNKIHNERRAAQERERECAERV